MMKVSDAVKLQMDYFYARPQVLAEGLMFADAKTQRAVLKECKKRGIDIAQHIAKMIDREYQLMQRLRTR